jgi:hypothetical protein
VPAKPAQAASGKPTLHRLLRANGRLGRLAVGVVLAGGAPAFLGGCDRGGDAQPSRAETSGRAATADLGTAAADAGVAFSAIWPAYNDAGTVVGLSWQQSLASSASGSHSSILAGTEMNGLVPHDDVQYRATCDPSGTSVITFDVAGTAARPVAGPFTLSGSVEIGPQVKTPSFTITKFNRGRVGVVKTFSETFTIHRAGGTAVTGTLNLDNSIEPTDTFTSPPPGWFSWGQCIDRPTSYGTQALAFDVTSDYGAAIATETTTPQTHVAPSGGSSHRRTTSSGKSTSPSRPGTTRGPSP